MGSGIQIGSHWGSKNAACYVNVVVDGGGVLLGMLNCEGATVSYT